MSEKLAAGVLGLLASSGARRVLALGAQAAAWLAPWVARHRGTVLHALASVQACGELTWPPGGGGRYDFALVAGVIEQLPAAEAGHLLARLRDLHVSRMLVVVDRHRCPLDDTDFRALGLCAAFLGDTDDDDLRAYAFELATYKRTPDWLNPRDWAHPELWDKYRW